MNGNTAGTNRDFDILLEFKDTEEIQNGSKINTPSPGISSDSADVEPEPGPKMTSISFYKKFFNVSTNDVLSRIKGSIIPTPGSNYLQENIKSNPDLYGPFWICATLAFTIAVCSNIIDYLESPSGTNFRWKYEFHVLTKAALIIFLYAWMIPVMVWSTVKWYLAYENTLHLLELICVYGYCLAVFIPISVLWIIYVAYIQWALMIIGTVLSGLVLVSSIHPLFGSRSYSLLAGLVLLHICFSIIIFMVFFHSKTA